MVGSHCRCLKPAGVTLRRAGSGDAAIVFPISSSLERQVHPNISAGHNDPDMLEIGNGLPAAEERTHFAMWAIMKSPLLLGADLTNFTQDQIDLVTNKYLLAFNQDPVVGEPAMPYKWGINPDWTFDSVTPAMYWSGASSDGTVVAMMNPTNGTLGMKAEVGEIPQLDAGASYDVLDVWTGESRGCAGEGFEVEVASHDTAVFLFREGCEGGAGGYE